MKQLAIALCLMAAPAGAQDAAFWGNAPSADGRSAVSVYPVDDGLHVADLVAVNNLTGGGPNDLAVTLNMGGLPLRVIVLQEPGAAPDSYYVTPPPGFYAVPPEVTLPEGGSAVIMIFEAGPMS